MKAIILLTIFLGIFFAQNSFGQNPKDTLKTISVKITGITCEGDLPIIKKKLINQPGVDEVTYEKAKTDTVNFVIKYHTSAIDEKKIRKTIEAAPSCDYPGVFPYKVKELKQVEGKNK